MIETNITKMFGIKYPIFSAPMGPFPTLSIALPVSEAGGLGVLSNINLIDKDTVKETQKMMNFIVEHTDKPFGFNIMTSRLNPSRNKMIRLMPKFIASNQKVRDQCVYALTSAGSSEFLSKSKNYIKLKNETGSKIKHFHVAPAIELGEKCIKSNVDGIVVTGTEGAGHQSYEEVSTLVLLQQMEEKFPDLPKIACGGFASGEGLAAALSLGAGAIVMGSRFIASEECTYHPAYKNIIPSALASDTTLVTGVFGPIRLWKNNYTSGHGLIQSREDKMAQEAQLTPEQLKKEKNSYDIIYDGDIINGAVPLGQSIGIINSIEKVSDIMDKIMKNAESAIKKVTNCLI
ncbi:MAG: hypothetical protein GY870_02580 [archaeon]|nr:hypothetical protein [archaeon]